MPQRPPKPTEEEIRSNALEMVGTMKSLVDRMKDLQVQVRDVQKHAEDVQVEVSRLAKDAGASWPQIAAVTGESADAVRVRAQRRRRGQG